MKKITKNYLIYIMVIGLIIIGLAALYYFNMQNTINQIMGK
jgi:hypothetical protein